MHDEDKFEMQSASLPFGFTALGVFLCFGATMACLAGATLLWPGTLLDPIWKLNPSAYRQLAPIGRLMGAAFLVLASALAIAAAGWFRRRVWGWRLAVAIIAIQLMGDAINCIRGDWFGGGVGVVIAGALLAYLLSSKVRHAFS